MPSVSVSAAEARSETLASAFQIGRFTANSAVPEDDPAAANSQASPAANAFRDCECTRVVRKIGVGFPCVARPADMAAASKPRFRHVAAPNPKAAHSAAACAAKSGESITTRLEKRFVAWGLPYVPSWLQTDHLTKLTLLWTAGNIGFAMLATTDLRWLLGVAPMIVFQYLTDLFDGAVGRSRQTGLVRWGFYADHLLDVLFLQSLMVAGAIISPPTLAIAWMGLSAAATLMMVSSFLDFGATGSFAIYHGGLGPTEVRGLMIGLIVVVVLTGTSHFWWSVPTLAAITTAACCVLAVSTAKKLRRMDEEAKAAASDE